MAVPVVIPSPGRRIAALAVFCVLSLVSACGSTPTRGTTAYTVKRGDTLYSIAWRHGLDYRQVARWNGIGRDYLIHPGQVLYLVPSSRADRQARRPPSSPQSATPAAAIPAAAAVNWSWPADQVQVQSTTRPNSSQGLTMAGQLGQTIRAAAAGSVVYVGSGLLGYGQLVIIKHNETFLSAYGHTEAVLIREGEGVAAGQSIATMGEGPGQRPMLYFEIRVNGQPVDPLRFLPALTR
ncbi:MAG: peptidoglycan DD-metalloendopeptidase family protein [Steroidobacteraceae bacterium]